MSETDHDHEQKRLFFGALQRLLEFGWSYLTITPDGIDVTDRFQAVHPVLQARKQVSADLKKIREIISQNLDWSNNSAYLSKDTPFKLDPKIWDAKAFGTFNSWVLDNDQSSEDTIVIKPRKRLPVALEQVFFTESENLQRLRSLYREGDFAIGIMCRGDTRADAVIAAILAERTQVGLPTNTAFRDDRMQPRNFLSQIIQVSRIDSVPYDEGATWMISVCDRPDLISSLAEANAPKNKTLEPTANVFVAAYPSKTGRLPHRAAITQFINDGAKAPMLVITVDVTSDGPKAEFVFSDSLLPRTSTQHEFKNAPWAIIGERKAERDAKPKPPKTWFSTTEDVAKSFVSRKAPRGYVSSRTIYFHGPVAYSIYDRNPIACILDTKARKPFLLMGRDPGISGTMAGTVSGACGDILAAAEKDFTILNVGDLKPILRLAGKRLEDLPRQFRKDKNEDDYPESASLHKTAFAKWLKAERTDRNTRLEKALQTRFPTIQKANCYQSLARLAALRDIVASTYDISLPDIGNANAYKEKAAAEFKAAEERLQELRDRKQSSPTP